MAVVHDWIYKKFRKVSGKPAIIYQEKEYSYDFLLKKITYFDKFIKKNIEPGKTVALLSDYSPYSIAFFFSLINNSNIIVPVITGNTTEQDNKISLSFSEIVVTFKDCDPEISFQKTTNKPNLYRKLNETLHSGLVLFSSGITGQPKAMLHDMDVLLESYKKDSFKTVNTLLFLTFDHIGGIDTLLRLLSVGGTLTIPLIRDPFEICRIIQFHKVNVLSCSPTFLKLMVISEAYKKYDLRSLKIIGFGAEKMPDYLFQKLKEIFPDVEIQQKFGTSETNAIRVKNHPVNPLFMKMEDQNITYKIVNDELWLKSETQALGYINLNESGFEDGWFKTGDIVETMDNDYFRIIGRIKEIINVGGEKVIPGEVERIIYGCPSVSECTVYGETNNLMGEIVVADVILNESYDEKSAKSEIKKVCSEKLDIHKRPVKLYIKTSIIYNDRFKKIIK